MGERVLVCGGRDYDDRARVFAALDTLALSAGVDLVIHGGATGADALAGKWAKQHNVRCKPFPAAWLDFSTPPVVKRRRKDGTVYNAAAGGIRNQRMLDEGRPTIVLAFAGGKGTADMIERAYAAGIEVMRQG